ncbi:MAG: hypothetical protein ACYTAF_12285 [Planctomycetota bacterium]|jgi:hypothetical protein
MRILVPLLLALLAAQEKPGADVRKALEKAGKKGYTYRVEGKHVRTGEFEPGPLLHSRVKRYRSVRYRHKVLIKGPAGLWKEPGEMKGEKTQNPDPEAVKIMRVLTQAEAPHTMGLGMLRQTKSGLKEGTARISGVQCDRWIFTYNDDYLKSYLLGRITKAAREKRIREPGEIYWKTMKGKFVVYVGKKEGQVVRIFDERKVKLRYRKREEREVYTVHIRVDFDDIGDAKADVPDEVRERLGLKKK